MTTRMSEVQPALDDPEREKYERETGLPWGMTHEDYAADGKFLREQYERDRILRSPTDKTECEFEGCTSPTSFKMRDRFGETHRACTAHEEDLDRWVRIHNGWDEAEPVGAGEENEHQGGGEGTKEDETG